MGEQRSGFLDPLRSGRGEDDSTVDPAFETLSALAGVARDAYVDFTLTPQGAAELFAMLRLSASDGQEWTVGPTTGRWFSRPAGSADWQPASLPVGLTLAPGTGPAWLVSGIGDYLQEHQVGRAGERERVTQVLAAVAAELAPAPESAPSARTAEDLVPEAPEELPSERGGALQSAPEPAPDSSLSAAIADEWNADIALVEALNAPDTVMPREGSQPLDPSWQPLSRDEYLPLETFRPAPDPE